MQTVDHLLQKTSRTFALTIPFLPEPSRTAVGLAYLLFRIADTLEDATLWPVERSMDSLETLAAWLESPDAIEAHQLSGIWTADPPVEHAGYCELLGELPFLYEHLRALPAERQRIITRHAARTARGMAELVERSRWNGGFRLRTIDELRAYCYVVAGIVGEMLTELYLLQDARLRPFAPDLRRRAALFGEALQLVNILKDASADAEEQRRYVPPSTGAGPVFALARHNLSVAAEYVGVLETSDAQRGIIAFNALILQLARATLARVEDQGSGAKLSRPEVFTIVANVQNALNERRSAVAGAPLGC